MESSARVARAHVGHIVLCSLALFGLAACGGDDASSGVSQAATTNTGLVAMRGGTIDRTSQPATTSTATTTATTTTTGSSGSTSTQVVKPPATPPVATAGVATLDWTPPTQNSDGSTLTNLAGYTVYYGTSPTALTQSVKLSNPGLTAYTVTNLTSGTWYFVVTSISSSGLESSRSGVVSTTI